MSLTEMESAVRSMVSAAKEMGLAVQDGLIDDFTRYGQLLQERNQQLNLTGVSDSEGIAVRHFLDSLSCATVTGDLGGRRLVDVGSGAGFPGLPLKILYPTMHLTLVESTAKKARFLEEVVELLELADVEILNERAETLGHDPVLRASHDWAVARAVAGMAVLAEYLFPFVRLGGRILVQKGVDAAFDGATTRSIVVVEKIAFTPLNYPRRPGIPNKRPL